MFKHLQLRNMNLKNKIYIPVVLISLLFITTSCEDFLSTYPTKNSNRPVETVEQLETLLSNVDSYVIYEQNNTAAFSTDDYDMPYDLYAAMPAVFDSPSLFCYTFNIVDMANRTSDSQWQNFYKNIYDANLILELVDKVSGDATLKARVKAEAHFRRAYSNWMLANYYCLPYCQANLNELGLPKKVTTGFEESYVRQTLEQTYEFIKADLAEALKVDTENATQTWRADRATVNAFLSRYYMHKGEYDKAIEAANYAINHAGNVKLKNYNNLTSGTVGGSVSAPVNFCETYNYTAAQMLNWEELFYARMIACDNPWYLPSPSLLALYDQTNDMRFKWFMLKNYNQIIYISTPVAYGYCMFSAGSGFPMYIFSGPTIQEVMLNKAECMVRKSAPDITTAMNLVNELRRNRIAPATPGLELSAANAQDALLKILEERRRELPFSQRWLDIRRFSVNETTIDDVTVTHEFYEMSNTTVNTSVTKIYTLPVGSRRYALPINELEIYSTNGQLKQNTY